MTKLMSYALLLPIVAVWPAAAQNWDTSGNNLLSGTYYFRQVIWAVQDSAGDVGEAISLYGNISFDGNGNYTISGVQVMDSSVGAPCTIPQGNCSGYPTSGTYSISASGYGWIDSIVSNDEVYGLVSNGIYVASTTENSACQSGNTPCYNDLFIAVPVPSTPFTNSSFQGTYTMASLDFTGAGSQGGAVYTRGSTFQMVPNGSGNVPAYTATGYIAVNGSTETTQSVPSAPYTITNGAVVYNLAGGINSGNAATVLIAGQKFFYLSPDGNFVVGGSPMGWDMIVGVRSSNAGSVNFTGLYYQAGALVDDTNLPSSANLQTFYGSYNIYDTMGDLTAHQRLDDAQFGQGYATYDYTYNDVAGLTNGSYTDSFNQYAFTNGGAVAIGIPTILNQGAYLGVTVLLKAPTFSPTGGVYIDPVAVVNAGSVVPFTAQLAPGELVSIFGTNLASTQITDLTLPTTLGGTQVMINGQAAPISFVSSNQVNAVVPINVSPGSIASIQVVNAMGTSNTVTNFVGATQPGVFNSVTTPAVQHADFSPVTSSSPVQPGETILVYLTGLGQLTGQNSTETFQVGLIQLSTANEVQATVAFSGSQSTAGGGYQMNITIPAGLSSDYYFLDILGPDSENIEAIIPIGTGSTATSIRRNLRRAHALKHARPKLKRNPKAPAF